MTRNPMRSHRSRNSGAGGLCAVRMALTPSVAQLLEAPLPDAQRHGRAECAAVVVQADAFDFHVFAVQPESRFGHKTRIPNAERYHLIIEDGVRRPDCQARLIEIRTIQLPEFGI